MHLAEGNKMLKWERGLITQHLLSYSALRYRILMEDSAELL